MNEHRHHIQMEFVDGGLERHFVCSCGFATHDVDEAARWDNTIIPRLLGETDEEHRQREKSTLYPFRYGMGEQALRDLLAAIPPASPSTWWQRFRQWCRDILSVLEN